MSRLAVVDKVTRNVLKNRVHIKETTFANLQSCAHKWFTLLHSQISRQLNNRQVKFGLATHFCCKCC